MNIEEIVNKQRNYFLSGKTLDIDFRINSLKKLYNIIKKYEKQICDALYQDLNKSDYESYMCEIGLTLSEISYMLKHIRKLAKKHTVLTPLSHFHSHSYSINTPYGNTLIISPWNYPFLLSIEPLVDSIAAGNTAIIKPSEYSPHTSMIMEKMIKECFDEAYVTIINGDADTSKELLKQQFDFIFFTGSSAIGKEVLKQSANHLTPVVLELGGKSPCIIDEQVNVKLAAKRIIFGKMVNLGQPCVAPDYILCHKNIKDALVKELIKQLNIQYPDPLHNKDYGKIINEKHFDRLLSLIDTNKVIYGGKYDKTTLKIEPVIMDNISFDDKVMQQEIFGPILPIITYDHYEDIYNILLTKPSPLALYIFSDNRQHIDEITNRIRFGGGCINDTLIHLATSNLPFGGVGNSGMGAYHGKVGFEAFSHKKAIVDKKKWIDLPMRYQPYDRKLFSKIIRIFLK